MATALTNTVFDHTTDAAYRAAAVEMRDLLLTGGTLAQTADTGQFDFASAVRPASNTDSAPLILGFTDALQATAPYFFAFYFGSGSSVNVPRYRMAIGTGTTGAGALTGVILTATIMGPIPHSSAATTASESAACGLPGEICVAHKSGAALGGGSQPVLANLLGLSRTLSHAGVHTDEGLVVYLGGSFGEMQCRTFRRLAPTVFGPTNLSCLITYGTTTSVAAGGERQVYAHASALPDTRPVAQFVTAVAAETPAGTIFLAQPPGTASPRTYRSLGPRVATPGAGADLSSHALCQAWQ
jgi:hypothetical protein